MPYLFTCPHCRTTTRVDDRYSGQSGQCVTCGKPIQVPVFADPPTTTSRDDERSRGLGSTLPTLGWFAAAAVVILLAASALIAVVRYGGQTVLEMRQARVAVDSMKNLEAIAAALKAYANDHGTFPPPEVKDTSGTPMYSWRVLILPYLGEEDLYNRFDLSKPWDHMSNTEIGRTIPSVYRHPHMNAAGLYEASAYYLVVGPGTLFPPSGPLGEGDITDSPLKTLLLVEGTPIGVQSWTEPHDLDFQAMKGLINSGASEEPGGLTENGVAVATADGRTHLLHDNVTPQTFRALVTPSGNEPLPDDVLD